MSSEGQHDSFLQVRFDVLQDEYCKLIGHMCSPCLMRGALSRNSSPRGPGFCPLCDCKKVVDTGLLLSHTCSRHLRAILPAATASVSIGSETLWWSIREWWFYGWGEILWRFRTERHDLLQQKQRGTKMVVLCTFDWSMAKAISWEKT